MNDVMEPLKGMLVVGGGNVGARVARVLLNESQTVFATTTRRTHQLTLERMGAQVIPWRWEEGASWEALESLGCEAWCVTVPPRGGQAQAEAFHRALQAAARKAGVRRLLWTSSTAVYGGCSKSVMSEGDAGHVQSRHTGVDLLALEAVHRTSEGPEFVAMRLGGLYGQGMHPALSVSRRSPVREVDGDVQWVHLDDAAKACATALMATTLGGATALNVVAPRVRSRLALLEATFPSDAMPAMEHGGQHRQVSSDKLMRLGFTFEHPDVAAWCKDQLGVWKTETWDGPHGPLRVDRHPSKAPHQAVRGRLLMVHGYKGFKSWGNWPGLADRWSRLGWEVCRMDFSHNGHVPPFDEDCVDEAAWSANRHHFEAEEVAFALHHLSSTEGLPLVVLGHSRGGGMAVLGASRFESEGGTLAGCAAWASVSDFVGRMPQGEVLERWRVTDRLEVVNGRTGQTLVHPFAFCEETLARREVLDVIEASRTLTSPLLAVHGTDDPVVAWQEGKALVKLAQHPTWSLIDGGNHVFGMTHPWPPSQPWPEPLTAAAEATEAWLQCIA